MYALIFTVAALSFLAFSLRQAVIACGRAFPREDTEEGATDGEDAA